MSAVNIDDLPPELIMKILQFLDLGSLKNAALTCKLWNSLTESTCTWSFKLEMSDEKKEAKTNFIMATDRKFGTIKVKWPLFMKCSEIHEIFRKHGVNVAELVLNGYAVDGTGPLADLLHLMPNLKHAFISIRHLSTSLDLPLDYVLPELKKLKKLEWSVCDQRLIKSFRKANVTTMMISESKEVNHYDSLVDFISSQNSLTSLMLKNVQVERSILVKIGKRNAPINFQLTKLTMNVLGEDDLILNFIKSQTETLKQIQLGAKTSRNIYASVFASTKADTLSVSICRLPRDTHFYSQLGKNHNVQTIELYGYYDHDVGFLRSFFELFPNIRSLILRDIRRELNSKILVIAQSLEKLESLTIGAIWKSSFGCMKFCNLRTLRIRCLIGKIDWGQFTKNNSRLTELTIEKMNRSVVTNDDIEQMVTNVGLKSIRLGDYFEPDDRFFEIIQRRCVRT